MRFRKNLAQLLEEEHDKLMVEDDLEDGGEAGQFPVLGYSAAQVHSWKTCFLLSKDVAKLSNIRQYSVRI